MAKRDEVMHKFGPQLFEALAMVLLEESNRFRVRLNMPEITMSDLYDQLMNHTSELTLYKWQKFP